MKHIMPSYIEKKLHDAVDYFKEGKDTEKKVLKNAKELGYVVVEESNGKVNEDGSFMHNVNIVNETTESEAWLHFNHPGKDVAKNNAEWFWYSL